MSIDLDAIQARADAATEGPWDRLDAQIRHTQIDGWTDPEGRRKAQEQTERDIEFVMNARTDVPAIIAYARDLEAQRDAARSVCHEREEELMELKGSCRAPSCILHRAHRGPCHVIRAALTATEGQA